MGLSQVVNYILPLLLIPYLINSIGLELYGVFIFFQTILFFSLTIVNYSYNITGVQRISAIAYEDSKEQIYNNIMYTRIFLCFLLIPIFMILSLYIELINKYNLEFYLFIFNIFGYSLFQSWFLQGNGNFKELMKINIIYKLIQFLLIIILITNESAFIYLCLIYGLTPLFMAIHEKFITRIYLTRLNIFNILKELHSNFYIFISLLIRNSNSSIVLFVIGLNFHSELLAIIGSLDKIVKAIRGVFDPIAQVLFQFVNKSKVTSKDKLRYINKLFLFSFIFGIFTALLMIIFPEYLQKLVFGIVDIKYNYYIYIFSVMPLLLILSNIFGIQSMLTFGYYSQYNTIMVISLFGTISLLYLFKDSLNLTVIAIPIIEIFVVIATIKYYIRIRNENSSTI